MGFRYQTKRMIRLVGREGGFGVWDSVKGKWVLNAEYISKEKADRITIAMNTNEKQNK